MKEYKICFITCFNDEIFYEESVRYIRSLHIPYGFVVELISISDAKSMTEGYNRAMRQSDAKYKVYLHEDVFIINKNFIQNVIDIFSNHSELALLGVAGVEKMPLSGIWWEGSKRYGKVFESSRNGETLIYSLNEVDSDYKTVEAVDGLILITQYDLPWREDLLMDWHMYAAAQCLEYSRGGYRVGVPNQSSPWVIHDCGPLDLNGFEEERLSFLKEYSKDLYPLVSILIPAYNRPYYLELALQSALYQSYQNTQIIIGDDSTNDEVQKVVAPYLSEFDNVFYYKNPMNLGIENWHKLYGLAKGDFINFLMDDDLFNYEKIEKMVDQFYKNDNVSLVTSYRQLIDENGDIIPSRPSTRKLFDKDTIKNGLEFGSILISQNWNAIGEPTTAMFRKSDLECFGYYSGIKFTFLNDFASWISLMEMGDVAYLSEPLSYFRQHGGQNQQNPKYKILPIEEWLNIIIQAKRRGFLTNESMFKESITNYIKSSLETIKFYQDLDLKQTLEVHSVSENLSRALQELLV